MRPFFEWDETGEPNKNRAAVSPANNVVKPSRQKAMPRNTQKPRAMDGPLPPQGEARSGVVPLPRRCRAAWRARQHQYAAASPKDLPRQLRMKPANPI